MKRTTRIAAAAAILIAPLMMALPNQSQSAFEVATVRPYKDDATAGGVVMIGGGCRGFDSPAPGTPNPGGPQMAIAVMGGPGPGGGGAGAPGPGRVAGPPTTPI